MDAGEISDVEQLDSELLRLVQDGELASMMRDTFLMTVAAGKAREEIIESKFTFVPLHSQATIFMLESGIEWFKNANSSTLRFDEYILKDQRYGWASQFTDKVERIDVKGSHLDFFKHNENVKV